jgi:predicted nucleic acid-binding protein
MAAKVLADTGAILALLDDSDGWHGPCAASMPGLPLPLVTSEAVLTELFHFLEREGLDREGLWDYLRRGVITLASIGHSELPALEKLMRRYKDRPMDFADATLVYLAEREGIQAIFTVDQDDFATYRIGGKRRFHILPVERL